MSGLTPAQLREASRNRRSRQAVRIRRPWMLPLLVGISLIGFIAATVCFAIQVHGETGRPRISRIVGDVDLPAQGLDITRVRPMTMVRARPGGSFRLTWDDGTLVDIGHGLVLVGREPRSISVGACDLGVLVPKAGPPLKISIFGATLTAGPCQFTAHVGETFSQLRVSSGALLVHEDAGADSTLTAGRTQEIQVHPGPSASAPGAGAQPELSTDSPSATAAAVAPVRSSPSPAQVPSAP